MGRQGPDPGRLPEPGLLRRGGVWDRDRGPALLLPAPAASEPGPGGRPGRHHRQPRAVPAHRRQGRQGPPRSCPGPDGRAGVGQPGPGGGGQAAAAGPPAGPRDRPLPLRGGCGDPGAARRPRPGRRPGPGRVGGQAAGGVRGRPAGQDHAVAGRPAPGRAGGRRPAGRLRSRWRPDQPGPGQRGGGGHGRGERLRPAPR